MQDVKKTIPFLGIKHRIAIVAAMSAFVVSMLVLKGLCTQDLQEQKECETLFSAAVKAEQQNDTIEAELRYEECRDNAKKFQLPKMEAAALHRLAVIKARNKKFTESLHLFERAIVLDSKNTQILCDFAQLYADRKDYEHAETILKNVISLTPDNPKALFNLGEVIALQRGDRHAEGFRYLKQAVGEAEAYRELARIYRSKGELREAESAEKRAISAEGQQTTLAAGPGTSPSLQPKRPATPPESVSPDSVPQAMANRAREETGNLEKSDVSAEQRQRQSGTSPIGQTPIGSTPIGSTPTVSTPASQYEAGGTAVALSENAATNQKKPLRVIPSGQPVPQEAATKSHTPAMPVDPFAMAACSPETLSATPSSAPSVASTAPSTIAPETPMVRRFPNVEPQKTLQPSEQSGVIDPFSFVQVAESKPPANNDSSFVKIITPEKGDTATKISLPKRSPISSDEKEKLVVRTFPGGAGRNEQTSVSKTDAGKKESDKKGAGKKDMGKTDSYAAGRMSNPLRQMPNGDTGLIDPASDVPMIASLPSYSSVGAKKIPRIDPIDVQEQSKNILNTVESLPEEFVARQPISLPVRETEGLQSPATSPATVVARREAPELLVIASENGAASVTKSAAKTGSSQELQASPSYVEIVQSGRGFVMTHAPDVMQFSPIGTTPPPVHLSKKQETTNKPVAIAARPQPQNTKPPVSSSLMRLPQIAERDSDYPKTIVNVAPTKPTQSAKSADAPQEASVETPADPFPVIAADIPQTPPQSPSLIPAQVAQSPQFIQPSPAAQPLPVVQSPPQVAQSPLGVQSLPDIHPPVFTHPQVPPDSLPQPQVAATDPASAAPFQMAKAEKPHIPLDSLPRTAATVPSASSVPAPASMPTPIHPFPVVDNPLKLVEVKKPVPLPSVSHVPMETPKVADVRVPSTPSPLPVKEEPAGFASTRKSRQAVEEPTGFARSRR